MFLAPPLTQPLDPLLAFHDFFENHPPLLTKLVQRFHMQRLKSERNAAHKTCAVELFIARLKLRVKGEEPVCDILRHLLQMGRHLLP